MKIKFRFVLIALFLTLQVFSQSSNQDVLFTVDGEPVLASEFIRVYNKNLDLVKDESQKDINNYLNLFIDYKLKLKEAQKLELDKKPSYQKELSNYRKQLAKNYLTDSNVTENLIREAYDRISYEVNASHILVKISENADPKDTLKAYNEIVKLRDHVLKDGFEHVQKEVHDGQNIFAENLGYFSGFKMIYKFESMAYNTPVGELSQPFRTRFGYHIVKVLDKRKNRGEVEVGHIMISKNNKSNDSLQQDPEERINNIYKRLEQGENFESLAKEFSEDKSSAKKGGKLSPFTGGQLSSKEFEEAAFSLKEKGEITKPIETRFGWHIIKLYDNKPLEPYDKLKKQLEVKVKSDSRSKLISNAFANKIKKKYNVTNNEEALNYFNEIVTQDYFSRTWSIPQDLEKDKALNQIGNKIITYGDFAKYLHNSQRRNRERKALNLIIKDVYHDYLNNEVLSYYEANLETENQEFANIVSEYRDGLLLFDLMETQIWEAAKKDTLGIKEYYKNHKETYFTPERIDAIVVSSAKEKVLKKVADYFEKGWSQEQITEAINKKNKINVIFTNGILEKGHQSLPQDFVFKTGVSKIHKHNNSYVIAKVKELLPKETLPFDDVKGRVITDFQNQIEIDWLKRLRAAYKVDLNQDVFNKIKEQIQG